MRTFRIFLHCALVLAACLMLAAPLHAIEVEAEGVAAVLNNNVAGAENQALLNAQRKAVEQGVGVIIDSNTFTRNFELISDKVLSESKGFVTKYKILSKGLSGGGSTFRVKIRATVSDELKDRLASLGILHQAMGFKRVLVVYHPVHGAALPRNEEGAIRALQVIRDELVKEGFRVAERGQIEKVYQAIQGSGQTGKPLRGIAALGLSGKADLLIQVENVSDERKEPFGGIIAHIYRSKVRVTVFETSDGTLVADTQGRGKIITGPNPGPAGQDDAVSRASEAAGREAVREAMQKVAVYYQKTRREGFKYTVTFKNFDDDELDQIIDYLGGNPDFYKLSNPSFASDPDTGLGVLEVLVTSSLDALGLQKMIRSGLKEKGILLRRNFAKGYVIVFSNPKRQN